MPSQKIDKYYGISASLSEEVSAKVLKELKANLKSQLEKKGEPIPPDAQFHVYHLVLSHVPRHFKVSGLENRLEELRVSIRLTGAAKNSGKIRLVDIGIDIDPDVSIKRSPSEITYRLTPASIEKNGGYADYIAAVFAEGCKEKHRRLEFSIRAHATPGYAGNFRNSDGTAVTNMWMTLSTETSMDL